MIRNLLAIFAFASCLAVFASAAVATYFHFQAIANIPAGGPRRRIVKVNRLNALLFPDELSPIGLQYRVRCLRTLTACLCFIVAMAATALYQPSEGLTDDGPVAGRDRGDAPGFGEKFSPGVLAGVEDIGVGREHTVGEIGPVADTARCSRLR